VTLQVLPAPRAYARAKNPVWGLNPVWAPGAAGPGGLFLTRRPGPGPYRVTGIVTVRAAGGWIARHKVTRTIMMVSS
jgi:hypothetical protein